jgi:hypothetical protein
MAVHIVCVPGFKIIMYTEQYILFQTWKDKYAFVCNYACIHFNFNVAFVKCYALYSLHSIFQMLMAHSILFQLFDC